MLKLFLFLNIIIFALAQDEPGTTSVVNSDIPVDTVTLDNVVAETSSVNNVVVEHGEERQAKVEPVEAKTEPEKKLPAILNLVNGTNQTVVLKNETLSINLQQTTKQNLQQVNKLVQSVQASSASNLNTSKIGLALLSLVFLLF